MRRKPRSNNCRKRPRPKPSPPAPTMDKRANRLAVIAGLLAAIFLTGCVTPVPNAVKAQLNLEYGRVDGHPLCLDLYPQKHPAGKLPVLLWIHGGSWLQGSKDFCPIAFMATQNLAIVSIDYRLSGTAKFPAQI